MTIELDGLLVTVRADLAPVDRAIAGLDQTLAGLDARASSTLDSLSAAANQHLSEASAASSRDLSGLANSAEAALVDLGRAGAVAMDELEGVLGRTLQTGRLGFEDLRSVAASTLDAIAQSALDSLGGVFDRLFARDGLGGLFGGGFGGSFGGGGLLSSLLGGLFGIGGRADGGPIAPNRPYWVGERGPELIVPATAGQVVPPAALSAAGPRPLPPIVVQVTGVTGADALRRSGAQVAQEVRRALLKAERDR